MCFGEVAHMARNRGPPLADSLCRTESCQQTTEAQKQDLPQWRLEMTAGLADLPPLTMSLFNVRVPETEDTFELC
jgi:hypothetical protein